MATVEEAATAGTAEAAGPFMRVRAVAKRYGRIRALGGVDLDLFPGEVHSLVGANGAGKSTLVRILAGVEAPDQGEVIVDGASVRMRRPTDAAELGLSFVHQELNLVPNLSVLENVAMGTRMPRTMVPWNRIRERARVVLNQLEADLPLHVQVSDLSVSDRWTLSLVRGLMRPARLVTLDEPTASFTEQEADRLFALVRRLASAGTAILYISHRLEEVLDLSDRITVLRDGMRVDEHARGDLDTRGLARAIAGVEVRGPRRQGREKAHGAVVFEARDVRVDPRVRNVSLRVRAGEILGIAGLVGAGRTEFVRAVAGAERIASGEMLLEGTPYRPVDTAAAVRRGVALVPEERRSQGLILDESVQFNVVLSAGRRTRLTPWLPLVSAGKANALAKEVIERLRVKADSPHRRVRELSGGNQQKVVIGRGVTHDPKLFILDEPTVGVDVGAREEIYNIIAELARAGTAVIVVSSDFDELQFCDRVVVFREGRTVADLPYSHATKSTLTHLCFDETPPGTPSGQDRKAS